MSESTNLAIRFVVDGTRMIGAIRQAETFARAFDRVRSMISEIRAGLMGLALGTGGMGLLAKQISNVNMELQDATIAIAAMFNTLGDNSWADSLLIARDVLKELQHYASIGVGEVSDYINTYKYVMNNSASYLGAKGGIEMTRLLLAAASVENPETGVQTIGIDYKQAVQSGLSAFETPMLNNILQKVGVDQAKFSKMDQGQRAAAILEGVQKYQEAAEAAGGTFRSQLSTFRDRIKALTRAATVPMFESWTQGLKRANEYLEAMIPKVERVATNLGGGKASALAAGAGVLGAGAVVAGPGLRFMAYGSQIMGSGMFGAAGAGAAGAGAAGAAGAGAAAGGWAPALIFGAALASLAVLLTAATAAVWSMYAAFKKNSVLADNIRVQFENVAARLIDAMNRIKSAGSELYTILEPLILWFGEKLLVGLKEGLIRLGVVISAVATAIQLAVAVLDLALSEAQLAIDGMFQNYNAMKAGASTFAADSSSMLDGLRKSTVHGGGSYTSNGNPLANALRVMQEKGYGQTPLLTMEHLAKQEKVEKLVKQQYDGLMLDYWIPKSLRDSAPGTSPNPHLKPPPAPPINIGKVEVTVRGEVNEDPRRIAVAIGEVFESLNLHARQARRPTGAL